MKRGRLTRKTVTGYLILAIALVSVLSSCKKYTDTPGKTDPRLSRPYCNIPEAVNYNWDFPGTPDNSTCFYPSDVFKGNFTYTDSIYNTLNVFVRAQVLNLSIVALDRTKIEINGFCGSSGTPLRFTASRRLRADVDTLIGYGQLLCRPQDTLTGYISRRVEDVSQFQFNLTVASDTDVIYHRGSAIKH